MKKLRALLALVGTIIVVGCNDNGSGPINRYIVTIEDHETAPYRFPSGVYYSYAFPEPPSSDFNVDSVFRQVYVAGVRLRDAWYKSFNTSCTPPGSRLTMPAFVEPGLVIRVDRDVLGFERMGFVETTKPDVGWCAYRVKHYRFVD